MRQQGEMVAKVARTSVLVVTAKEEETTGELWQAEFETAATRTRFNVTVARLAEISNCSEVVSSRTGGQRLGRTLRAEGGAQQDVGALEILRGECGVSTAAAGGQRVCLGACMASA